MESLSQKSQSMRKDLKAPDSYPKKNQLSAFGSKKTVHTLKEVSSIKCLDVDAEDKFIAAVSVEKSKSTLCLYDLDTKVEKKIKSDSMAKDVHIVKLIPGT